MCGNPSQLTMKASNSQIAIQPFDVVTYRYECEFYLVKFETKSICSIGFREQGDIHHFLTACTIVWPVNTIYSTGRDRRVSRPDGVHMQWRQCTVGKQATLRTVWLKVKCIYGGSSIERCVYIEAWSSHSTWRRRLLCVHIRNGERVIQCTCFVDLCGISALLFVDKSAEQWVNFDIYMTYTCQGFCQEKRASSQSRYKKTNLPLSW